MKRVIGRRRELDRMRVDPRGGKVGFGRARLGLGLGWGKCSYQKLQVSCSSFLWHHERGMRERECVCVCGELRVRKTHVFAKLNASRS